MTHPKQPVGSMPVVFVGHGSPMNAIEENRWSQGFRELAADLPRPRAILAVSAHWYVSGTYFTGNSTPKTIHDFSGFPPELYRIQYPAPGDADLVRRGLALLGHGAEAAREDWGLDHGTWSVLRHMWPEAEIPVVQLSIDRRLPPAEHLRIGRALAPLREEGVLLLASGNIVHNLRHALSGMGRSGVALPEWARSFDADIAQALTQHDHDFLGRSLTTDYGAQAHPSPDHYFPLLYAAGAAADADTVAFPITGFDLGSISMRAVKFG